MKIIKNMKNILIEVIINNQCNKRCQYCDLDFKNKSLSKENIDDFLFFFYRANAMI